MTSPSPDGDEALSSVCAKTADALEDGLGSADPATGTLLRIGVWANRLVAAQLDHGLTPDQVQKAAAITGHQQATLAATLGDE